MTSSVMGTGCTPQAVKQSRKVASLRSSSFARATRGDVLQCTGKASQKIVWRYSPAGRRSGNEAQPGARAFGNPVRALTVLEPQVARGVHAVVEEEIDATEGGEEPG